MTLGTYNTFKSGSSVGYAYESSIDLLDKKQLQLIIKEFHDIKDNSDMDNGLVKSEIKKLFFDYSMMQTKNWDKDFEDFYKVFIKSSQKTTTDWLHNQYVSNSKLLPLETPNSSVETKIDNIKLPSLNIKSSSNTAVYDWKDQSKSLNERIREGYKLNIPAASLAKMMDVKTSRVSSVYYKIKNR